MGSIVYTNDINAFVFKWDLLCTPVNGSVHVGSTSISVHIGSHFHKTAYMHQQTTIGIHEEQVPKLMSTHP